jgi:Chaperone of endosialidase
MPYVNTLESESIQVGTAAIPPTSTAEFWPSIDPTKPFTTKSLGINQNLGITNQFGAQYQLGGFFGIGAQSQIGFDACMGIGADTGGAVDSQPKLTSSAITMNFNSPNGKLNGLWRYNGSIICVAPCSDSVAKKNITPLSNSLDKIKNLRGVSFDWNESIVPRKAKSEGRQIGLIAQEVEEIVPEVVTTEIVENQDLKSVNYALLTSLLIEAVKEQQKQIEELNVTVKELSTKCNCSCKPCYTEL